MSAAAKHRAAGALALLAALAGSALTGCSAQQAYGAGQAWQQQACARIPDAGERSRCRASTSRSYEEYKREAEAAQRAR